MSEFIYSGCMVVRAALFSSVLALKHSFLYICKRIAVEATKHPLHRPLIMEERPVKGKAKRIPYGMM
ncbi:MAG: hypothetical protein ACI3YD_00105, partial [Alloprevotella sp.]